MSGVNQRQNLLALYENKIATFATIQAASAAVTSNPETLEPAAFQASFLCGFVVAEGEKQPFCDEPSVKGSSYCASHRALCVIEPDSGYAARILIEQERIAAEAESTKPPPDLAFFAGAGLPEPPEPPEPMEESDEERLAGIELARERAEITDN